MSSSKPRSGGAVRWTVSRMQRTRCILLRASRTSLESGDVIVGDGGGAQRPREVLTGATSTGYLWHLPCSEHRREGMAMTSTMHRRPATPVAERPTDPRPRPLRPLASQRERQPSGEPISERSFRILMKLGRPFGRYCPRTELSTPSCNYSLVIARVAFNNEAMMSGPFELGHGVPAHGSKTVRRSVG